MTEPRIDYSLGEYQSAVNGALEKMRRDNVIERIRAKDYTLWKSKPDEIVNRLGWLEAPSETLLLSSAKTPLKKVFVIPRATTSRARKSGIPAFKSVASWIAKKINSRLETLPPKEDAHPEAFDSEAVRDCGPSGSFSEKSFRKAKGSFSFFSCSCSTEITT